MYHRGSTRRGERGEQLVFLDLTAGCDCRDLANRAFDACIHFVYARFVRSDTAEETQRVRAGHLVDRAHTHADELLLFGRNVDPTGRRNGCVAVHTMRMM